MPRSVRVDTQFFVDLDNQLDAERGPDGQPSASDFLLIDLPPIAAVFATGFDDLPSLYVDRDDYRYLVSTGSLVAAATVIGHLSRDGVVVLFGIEIDLD